jgi:NAD(P)-dependent dehydrogenase (short-subunit alcohol dehydrogenase family)
VRDSEGLTKVVEDIGAKHGRLDGLIAAAGIQQETPALEYTAKGTSLTVNSPQTINLAMVLMW